jgi:hypothetical protein
MIVSAISSDAPTVANTAIGITRMNRPELPPIIVSGRERQHDRAGAAEDRLEDLSRRQDLQPACASVRRAGKRAMFSRPRRWRSSTSNPSATTKPTIEIWFSE